MVGQALKDYLMLTRARDALSAADPRKPRRVSEAVIFKILLFQVYVAIGTELSLVNASPVSRKLFQSFNWTAPSDS